MHLDQFLLFISTALLLALAPGPDNFGVLGLGISTGRRAAMGFALGCAAGCLNHTLLAVVGVSALLAASPIALKAAQWIGAAYLCWIAFQILRNVLARRGFAVATGNAQDADRFLPHFRRGLIANAINPKVAIFFLAFLPQFLSPSGWPAWAQLSVLGLLFALCSGLVFGSIALGADWIGARLRDNPVIQNLLEATTALLFLGLAVRLLCSDLRPATARTA